MEIMTKEKRPRRSFSQQTKKEAVDLVRSSGLSVAQVARDMDLTQSALRKWVKQAEIDEGAASGVTSDERAELARLRAEVRVLREERDILKRATAFFAKEIR